MRTAVLLIVTLGLGFALGWYTRPIPQVPPAPIVMPSAPLAKAPARSVATPPSLPTRGTAETRQLQADKRALVERVEDLTVEVRTAHETQRLLEGAPIGWPNDVDPRYREDNVLSAFRRALEKAEVTGEIESLDCTEYPCIAHGSLDLENPRDRAALERVFARASAAFPGAEYYLSQTIYADDPTSDDPAQQRFSMAFYEPADDAEKAALALRLRSRKNAFVDADR